jgi:hypothetical protein
MKYSEKKIHGEFNNESDDVLEHANELSQKPGVAHSAKEQIELKEKFSVEQTRIDQKYEAERGKLGGQPLNAPANTLGNDDPDRLQQRYENLLTRWQHDRSRLNDFQEYSIDRARSSGTTLSEEFKQEATNSEEMNAGPEAENDNDQELREVQPPSPPEYEAEHSRSRGRHL